MQQFRYLPNFLYEVAHKVAFYVGIGVGIIFAIIAYFTSMEAGSVTTISVCITAVALFLASYGVYREERRMRAEREKVIRVTARLGSYSSNIPDPGPNKVRLRVGVFWEVWAEQDITFDRLALNLIHVYDKHRWQFWKRTKFPRTGIPPIGKDSTQYRTRVNARDPQPFKDNAEFDYVADSDDASPHWLLELVLIAGTPIGEYRIPVFIDWDEIHSRGTHPPL